MSKKKSLKKSSAGRPMPSRRLMASLQRSMIYWSPDSRWRPWNFLKELMPKYSDHPDVLVDLVNVYSRLGDYKICEAVHSSPAPR
jgi:hypothetical protein